MRILWLMLLICGFTACTDSTAGSDAPVSRPRAITAPPPSDTAPAAAAGLNGWTPVSQYMRQQFYRGKANSGAEVRTAVYKFTTPNRGIRQVFWQTDGNENCDMKQSFRWQLDPMDESGERFTLFITPSVVQQIGASCPSDVPMSPAMSAGFNEPFRLPATFKNEQVQIEGWSY